MYVVGLDLSLTSSGVATPKGVFTIKPKREGVARLIEIRDSLEVHLWDSGHPADLICVEGYSFASKFRGEALGELGGVVRVSLHEHGFRYVVVQPATLKSYATGAGNATKERVLVQAVKRSGVEFRTTDEADAAWLMWMGLDHLGAPAFELPAKNREALAKVHWPTVQPIPAGKAVSE